MIKAPLYLVGRCFFARSQVQRKVRSRVQGRVSEQEPLLLSYQRSYANFGEIAARFPLNYAADRLGFDKKRKMKPSFPDLIDHTLQRYIQQIRPPEDVRNQLDIGYKREGQDIFIEEIRPQWDDPKKIHHYPYAKIKHIKSRQHLKLYWQRASLKWELYKPFPESSHLQKLLDVIDEDSYGCFKG